MNSHTHVFVYGSLKFGFGNWAWALNRAPIVDARLRGFALHSLGAFPCVVPNVSAYAWGEVFRINATDLRTLDELEGTDVGLYRRVRVNLDVPGLGFPLRAFTYVMDAAPVGAPMILSGVWTTPTRHVWTHDATHDDAAPTHDDAEPWADCDGACFTCSNRACISHARYDDAQNTDPVIDPCDDMNVSAYTLDVDDAAPMHNACAVCDAARTDGWGDTCATCRAVLATLARGA